MTLSLFSVNSLFGNFVFFENPELCVYVRDFFHICNNGIVILFLGINQVL